MLFNYKQIDHSSSGIYRFMGVPFSSPLFPEEVPPFLLCRKDFFVI